MINGHITLIYLQILQTAVATLFVALEPIHSPSLFWLNFDGKCIVQFGLQRNGQEGYVWIENTKSTKNSFGQTVFGTSVLKAPIESCIVDRNNRNDVGRHSILVANQIGDTTGIIYAPLQCNEVCISCFCIRIEV